MQQSLEERYGRTRQRGVDRRVAWTAIGVIALGLVLFLTLGGWRPAQNIEAQNLDYSIGEDGTVEARFEVTATPGAQVMCAVEALSESFATVGWKIIELPVTDLRTRVVTQRLVTTSPPTTAHVRQCWLQEEAEPGA